MFAASAVLAVDIAEVPAVVSDTSVVIHSVRAGTSTSAVSEIVDSMMLREGRPFD